MTLYLAKDLPITIMIVYGVVIGNMVFGLFIGKQKFNIFNDESFIEYYHYRGVIIINTEHKLQHIEEPKSVLAEEIKDEIQKWSLIAKEERWQNFETRLKIRDACPIGKEKWRYSGDMLDYFFPLNTTKEEVIKRIKSST